MNEFELKILRLNWICNIDEGTDLCAHGDVYVRIGDEIVSDHQSGNWNLRSTGLYLLRTLLKDFRKGQYGSQLLACCGHSMVEDSENKGLVVILGCGNGIDWTINHIEQAKVRHITENGVVSIQDFKEFKFSVTQFIKEVEGFYRDSLPKILPEDAYDRRMYVNFWREWNELKVQNNINTDILISPQ